MDEQRRRDTGVSRRVFFQAWCRNGHSWKGPERDNKSMSEYDRAMHEVDHHGGSLFRGEPE